MTLDAIHCNPETCHEIVENAGGNYMVGLKDNQRNLRRQIQSAFETIEPADCHRAVETGHGRIESRTVHTIAVESLVGLPHARTAVRVCRHRETAIKGKAVGTTEETAYFLTNIPASELSAQAAGILIRGHWGIENRLHHVKDASMQEDRYRANNGMARIMAALRSIAALVLGNLGTTVVVAMRRIGANLHKATKFLTCKTLKEFRLCFLK